MVSNIHLFIVGIYRSVFPVVRSTQYDGEIKVPDVDTDIRVTEMANGDPSRPQQRNSRFRTCKLFPDRQVPYKDMLDVGKYEFFASSLDTGQQRCNDLRELLPTAFCSEYVVLRSRAQYAYMQVYQPNPKMNL